MALANYREIEQEAKRIYGINAAYEMCEHWGERFDERANKIKCRWHDDHNPSLDWNKKDNHWKCFAGTCGKVYGIMDFYMEELGLNYWAALKRLCDKAGIEYDFNSERHNTRDINYKYPVLDNCDRTAVENYFEIRKISQQTLDYAKVGAMQNERGDYVAFNFYDTTDKLVGVKYRTLLPKSKENGARFFWQSNTSPCTALYNMNQCNPNNPLYITEGMIDALSIIEVGKKNVVSIPGGANDFKWIDENLDWLEQFDKIILWFDSDEAGIKCRNEAMRRLGAYRTDYIFCAEIYEKNGKEYTIKDANELLIGKGKESVLWYLDNPVQSEIDGIDDVADAPDFDIESAEGWYTKIGLLDETIYKGLFSTFGIISGFKGSGKSTFVNQLICEWLTQGYDTFVFSGELSLSRFKRWIERMMAGIEGVELSTSGVPKISLEVQKKMRDWYRGHMHYFNTTKVEPTPENILERIEYLVRKKGVRFVVIDNLMTISFNCRKDEELSKQKEFCNKLMLLKNKYDLCIFLVDHPIKLADTTLIDSDHIRGTGDITNMADYIFIIQRYMPEHKEDPRGWPKYLNPVQFDNLIRVRKNRELGFLKDIEVYFDPASSKFYRQADELYRHYGWNTEPQKTGCTDPYTHGVINLIKKEI